MAEEEEGEEVEGGGEVVRAAERGDGVFGAHMHGGVYGGRAIRGGGWTTENAVLKVRHVSGFAGVDTTLGNLQQEAQRRVFAV